MTRNTLSIVFLILAFILAPFALWGDTFNTYFEGLYTSANLTTKAYLVIIVLSLDSVLPVPSSVVAAYSGYDLGFFRSFVSIYIGFSVSSILGFLLGKYSKVLINEDSKEAISSLYKKHGVYALVLVRGVPVLSEASLILLGMCRQVPPLAIVALMISNGCLALMYSASGSIAALEGNLYAPLVISILIPLLLILLLKVLLPKSPRDMRTLIKYFRTKNS